MLALKDDLTLYHGKLRFHRMPYVRGGSEPMRIGRKAVTDEQREACAVVVMRTMLEDWCDDTGVPLR